MSEISHHMTDPVMSIGTFAAKVGLSVSAIRKYETEGLIISRRTPTGRRLFSREDIDRVGLIQHLINHIGLNIEGIRRLQALFPCWEILPCTLEDMDRCPAYRDTTKPCWMVKHRPCSAELEKCRICPVYRLVSQCTEDMKSVVHGQKRVCDHVDLVIEEGRNQKEE